MLGELSLGKDAPEGEAFIAENKFQKVWYHRVGTDQGEDVLVYKRDDEPDWGFAIAATDDGRYLVITVSQGTDDRYRILYKDLAEPDVLAEVAASAGVDGDAVAAAATDAAAAKACADETAAAAEMGVFGAPHMLVDGEPFWGHDRMEHVERWIETGGW